MPLDKQCRKCSKKESQSDFIFASVYGLCNECHTAFLPYLHKELQRFINMSKRKKASIQGIKREEERKTAPEYKRHSGD